MTTKTAKITKRAVDDMVPGDMLRDTEVGGFVVRCLKSGTRTYGLRYTSAPGKQRWLGLGIHGKVTPEKARGLAKVAVGKVAEGKDPGAEKKKARARAKAEAAETLRAVSEAWLVARWGMTRDEDGNAIFGGKLRSGPRRLRTLELHVWPTLGNAPIATIKRSEIVKQLDGVAARAGLSAADTTLSCLSALFVWYASRDDNFHSPIVRGMRRVTVKELTRKRFLDDEEIRDLWCALDEGAGTIPDCFRRFVRTLLLTGLRRHEVSRGERSEIATLRRDNAFYGPVWTIPGSRMKGKIDHAVPLTPAVTELLATNKAPFIFSKSGGARPFSSLSRSKYALDAAIGGIRERDGRPPMPAWVLHDLRRTAKTLMQRAGVQRDISERVLAHTIGGVEGVYDCYEYLPEKFDALTRLAALVERIVHPVDNVVEIPRTAAE